MKLTYIQNELNIDAGLAKRVQKLIREAFHAGFEHGHYADPDPAVTPLQDEDNRWNEWQDEER